MPSLNYALQLPFGGIWQGLSCFSGFRESPWLVRVAPQVALHQVVATQDVPHPLENRQLALAIGANAQLVTS
jgi:hypothetical protein